MSRYAHIVMNLDRLEKGYDPRDCYAFEIVTSNHDRAAARYAGELCAEFSPECHFELVEVTLN